MVGVRIPISCEAKCCIARAGPCRRHYGVRPIAMGVDVALLTTPCAAIGRQRRRVSGDSMSLKRLGEVGDCRVASQASYLSHFTTPPLSAHMPPGASPALRAPSRQTAVVSNGNAVFPPTHFVVNCRYVIVPCCAEVAPNQRVAQVSIRFGHGQNGSTTTPATASTRDVHSNAAIMRILVHCLSQGRARCDARTRTSVNSLKVLLFDVVCFRLAKMAFHPYETRYAIQ